MPLMVTGATGNGGRNLFRAVPDAYTSATQPMVLEGLSIRHGKVCVQAMPGVFRSGLTILAGASASVCFKGGSL